jgi:hypothetical protein
MPGSLTTRSRAASRDDKAARVVFGVRHTLDAPDGITIAAQWLAYAHPCRRFAPALAGRRARLGADVGRYAFIAEDLHLLSPAGLPAHARKIHERGHDGLLVGQALPHVAERTAPTFIGVRRAAPRRSEGRRCQNPR